MKTGRDLNSLVDEVRRQLETKEDLMVRSNAIEMHSNGASHLIMRGEEEGGVEKEAEVTDYAHNQLGDHLAIPSKYYDLLRRDDPSLLDFNVNRRLATRPPTERRMVRTLDGRARAFLSDKYRRLDNWDLISAVLPALDSVPGLELASAELTDRRIYIKVTTPRIQGEVRVGQVVQAGAVIGNSEVGDAAIYAFPWSLVLACLNGAEHRRDGIRKTHSQGVRITDVTTESMVMLSDRAQALSDAAIFASVGDVVKTVLTEAGFEKILEPMREAAGVPIRHPVKAVEVLAKQAALTIEEQEQVLQHFLGGGDHTLWGLANSVTRTATDAESYDRSSELERLGGSIITLPRSDYRELVAA